MEREPHSEDDSVKTMIFRAMVWAVGILLSVTGVTVGYFYRVSQEAIASNLQELRSETTKQWERIALIERKQDALEWTCKQTQLDLTALKGKH